jgi:hypothetical protein
MNPRSKAGDITAPATVAMPNSPLIAGRRPDMTIPFRNDSGFFTYISTASRITSGELFEVAKWRCGFAGAGHGKMPDLTFGAFGLTTPEIPKDFAPRPPMDFAQMLVDHGRQNGSAPAPANIFPHGGGPCFYMSDP